MGMMARAREGKWNGGKVLGYDIVEIPSEGKKRKETKLVINEKEAITVRRIFELYSEGHGYKATVNRVNKEGHKSKRGNAFSTAAIKEILKNPVYIGKIRYNVRQDWNEKRRRNINPDPILVDGEHEAIIDIATWGKVQIILKDRSKTHNRRSEEHTSELQSRQYLVCRLLLEKKKKKHQLTWQRTQGKPREQKSRKWN